MSNFNFKLQLQSAATSNLNLKFLLQAPARAELGPAQPQLVSFFTHGGDCDGEHSMMVIVYFTELRSRQVAEAHKEPLHLPNMSAASEQDDITACD